MKTIRGALFLAIALTGPLTAQINFDSGSGASMASLIAASGQGVVPVSAPAPVQERAAQPLRDWTVMVYMNNKSNLDQAGVADLNELESVGSTSRVNIVVQMGRAPRTGSAKAGGASVSSRFYITRDNDPRHITSRALSSGPSDMGDYRDAIGFVRWARTTYPARRYMLVMWNHGGGWLSGVSSDDETKNIINTVQIGQLMRAAGPLDVLAFDACLMQMAEVAYEVKDTARVIVGSEQLVPGDGFPYDTIMADLASRPAMDAEALGADIVDRFGAYYRANPPDNGRDAPSGVTLSAIRGSQLQALARKVSDFAALARSARENNSLRGARRDATRYTDPLPDRADPRERTDRWDARTPYVDLYDFVDRFERGLSDQMPNVNNIRSQARSLMAFITGSLVIRSVATGYDAVGFSLAGSHGISIYMPPRSPSMRQGDVERMANVRYRDLAFQRTAHWLELVTYIYSLREREGRDLPPVLENPDIQQG